MRLRVLFRTGLSGWLTMILAGLPGLIAARATPEIGAVLSESEQLEQQIGKAEHHGEIFLRAPGNSDRREIAAAVDWAGWGEALLETGRAFPEADAERMHAAVIDFFRRADRWAPQVAKEIEGKMAASPNPVLRQIAAARVALVTARTEPLEMRFTAVDGREVDLERLRGKVVLIDFWAATWCGACKVQEPLMKEIYARYHAQGFEIIGIACELKESDRAFLLDYVKTHEMPWPQYFDGQGMKNPYTRRYGFSSLPQFFLLNQASLLVAHTSSSGGLRNLEAVVRQQLGLPPLQPGDETKGLGARD